MRRKPLNPAGDCVEFSRNEPLQDPAMDAAPPWQSAKILFHVGPPESVIAHEGVLDPGVAYVAKPFSPEQISSRVRDILAGA
jgi:hypothetical protein